jgi:cell division protein ZapE
MKAASTGRLLRVPRQARGVARFPFRDLCLAPLWISDYRAIAQAFHTVMIDGIPTRFAHRNHARRFCALIDILHDFRVKLIASADVEPDGLLAGMIAPLQPALGPPSPLSEASPEMLEFRRTISRLHQMRSPAYTASTWRGDASGKTSA